MCNERMRYFRKGGGLTLLRKRYELSPAQLRVMEYLLTVDDPELGCFPKQTTISEETGLPLGTVRHAISAVQEKGAVIAEKKDYYDGWGRKRKGRLNHYSFAEEVEHLFGECVQIGEAREEHERRSKPMRLSFPAGEPAPIDPISGKIARENADIQQNRAAVDCEPEEPMDPISGKIAREKYQYPAKSRAKMPDISGQILGVGGGGSDLLQKIHKINHHHPSKAERILSFNLMRHPSIAMPRQFADALAAAYPARSVLQHCMIYLTDFEAGQVHGVGVLIHRLAHGLMPRSLNEREKWHDLYQEAFHALESLGEAVPE